MTTRADIAERHDTAGLRERKKRETRRALNLAALDLVEEKGFAAVTTEEISARAGVSAERFTALAAEIPNQPDVKAATDHNSRIMVEVGITILQLVQLQSMQTVGDGLTGVSAAAQMAEEKKFMDLTMPDLE